MKKVNSQELKKAMRYNFPFLITALVFLIITVIFIYIGYQEKYNVEKNIIPMSELAGDVKKLENKNAYIDVAIPPFLFATYQKDGRESDEKFYLVMDKEDLLYIVYMTDKEYQKLSEKNLQSKPIRIVGVTEKISSQIQELAISAYNKELGEEYLSLENFDSFVGPVMLNTSYIIDNSLLYYIIGIISFGMFSIFLSLWLSSYFKNRKVLKNYSKEDLERIGMQISGMGNNPYKDMKLYFIKEHIVDLSQNLIILKYEDIIWAYPSESRCNGLIVKKYIKVIDKTNHVFDIANTKYIKKDKEKIIDDVLKKLKHKNEKIIIGYSKEIKKAIKAKIKHGESLENLDESNSKKEKIGKK